MARRLLREEGFMCGGSSGTAYSLYGGSNPWLAHTTAMAAPAKRSSRPVVGRPHLEGAAKVPPGARADARRLHSGPVRTPAGLGCP